MADAPADQKPAEEKSGSWLETAGNVASTVARAAMPAAALAYDAAKMAYDKFVPHEEHLEEKKKEEEKKKPGAEAAEQFKDNDMMKMVLMIIEALNPGSLDKMFGEGFSESMGLKGDGGQKMMEEIIEKHPELKDKTVGDILKDTKLQDKLLEGLPPEQRASTKEMLDFIHDNPAMTKELEGRKLSELPAAIREAEAKTHLNVDETAKVTSQSAQINVDLHGNVHLDKIALKDTEVTVQTPHKDTVVHVDATVLDKAGKDHDMVMLKGQGSIEIEAKHGETVTIKDGVVMVNDKAVAKIDPSSPDLTISVDRGQGPQTIHGPEQGPKVEAARAELHKHEHSGNPLSSVMDFVGGVATSVTNAVSSAFTSMSDSIASLASPAATATLVSTQAPAPAGPVGSEQQPQTPTVAPVASTVPTTSPAGAPTAEQPGTPAAKPEAPQVDFSALRNDAIAFVQALFEHKGIEPKASEASMDRLSNLQPRATEIVIDTTRGTGMGGIELS